jgi:putative DNA primase/helicase
LIAGSVTEFPPNGAPLEANPRRVADLDAPAVEAFPLTDLGNAERLVAQHGKDLRFATGLGWFAWDGKRWRRDSDGETMRRMKTTVRRLLVEASECDDREQRSKISRHALQSESEPKLRAALTLAQTEAKVVVAPESLDRDPWLLNVANGTIDLRTGRLREHCRGDLITKIAPTHYRPDTRSVIWDRFLKKVTQGDDELASFLQRAVGYSLTGDISEEVLFFVHGFEATGKSTCLEALRAALGEYSATADFESFLKRRGDSGVRNDIARMRGTRLVVSLEVDEGKALAEGVLKALTGGDTVTARFLYRELFEFKPTFAIWLAANSRPRVSAEDGAMWRRIPQVPFVAVIPEAERDPALKRTLTTDAPELTAILAWAVQGCLDWQQRGLAVPQRVCDYTRDYRAEQDPLRDWLDECCTLDKGAFTTSAKLRNSYEAWCADNGERPVNRKALAASLRARDCTDEKRGTRGWVGIRLD